MILSDNETKVDLLNSEAIAKTIVTLITNRPDRPITIGVHGDWGAGKSSVLEMIESSLSSNTNVLCIKFNGWRFQGFEDAKIALIEGIVTELIEKRSLFTKAADEVRDVYKRIDWLKVAKKTAGFAITTLTGVPTPEVINTLVSGLKSLSGDPTKLATKENIDGLISQATDLLKPKDESKNIPKEIGEFRKAFDALLKKAGVDQLIVLIDDLDRCLPETAIETLEAIRLFVFTDRTAFVIAADEGMIEYAVRRHFPDLPDTTGHQAYTRNYLEKLIQVPFRIPILGELETKIYVTLLLIGSEIGEDVPEFTKLIEVARERLKKPWDSLSLDSAIIRTTLGNKASQVQTALLLSDQVGPILASGTKGNPRQIKRFLNTLILRQKTADARGFGQLIDLPVLAKLMIAERFLPRLFEQIANSSATSQDGICKEIFLLENNAEINKDEQSDTGKSSKKKEETSKAVVVKQDALIQEWLTSKEIQEWAAMQPKLSNVDLRPYIFVAKDKKDFFGSTSKLGHLAELAEKLFGPKFSVQGLDSEIKELSSGETIQIFEAIRARMINTGNFQNEPVGIYGLISLVKSHSHLQPNLLDFLESLPRQNLGVWIAKGWEGVIVDVEQKRRFDILIDEFSVSTNNPILKTVALGIQKMRNKK